MKATELKIGESALITSVGGESKLRGHLLGMGIVPGSRIFLKGMAPMGDPLEIIVQSYTLTLRKEEAQLIDVKLLTPQEVEAARQAEHKMDAHFGYKTSVHMLNSHPGFGESGKYHSEDHANPLSKEQTLNLALVGQQNSGKTTLFNRLTGSKAHVGNFPGVTVERKDGYLLGHEQALITDLPGIYSLSTYTQEEIVSRDYVLKRRPNAIINIIDASNIERHLYLTMQLMELDIPMVLAINMIDELRSNGGAIRLNLLEKEMGLPVVAVSAAKEEGIEELIEHALHIARYQEKPARQDFCPANDYGGAIHRCLHGIMHLIEDHAKACGLPLRYAASKLVDGDQIVMEELALEASEKQMIESIIAQMESEMGLDRQAAMAQMRYTFIHRLCSQSVVKPKQSKEKLRSNKLDKILTGKYTAFPAFVLILASIFYLTFNVIGVPLQDLLDKAIQGLGHAVGEKLVQWNVSDSVRSLVVDAIFGGVGSVLSFVPIIIVLFFFLSILEDSGYMSRVAFVCDAFLRKIGLSGRSVVPMLIGFGCTVPGVMAARTLPSAKDRKATILLTPFMSCSAKIPIYAFFSATFFPSHGALAMISMYLLGIVLSVVVALLIKLFRKGIKAAPFVMEMPPYRLPQAKNVANLLWDKTKDFVQKAFTVIFLSTIVIWFLQSFDFSLNLVSDYSNSMLSKISGIVAPIFSPMGLGDWRVVTSLLSGFIAKESVVSTMEVLNVASTLSIASAAAMMVFCLLYTPCVAAIAAIKRELGTYWAVFVVLFQCALAWLVSWITYLIF